MAARAMQPAGYPAGQAQVQVSGADGIDVDSLEVCISGMQDTVEKHLDPRLSEQAWTTTFAWFRPGSPRTADQALVFDLEPSVTWHLSPHAPYVLRLRDGRGFRREERMIWVAIRLPSRAPQGYVAPQGPAAKRQAQPAPVAPTASSPDQAAEAARLDAERIVQEKAAQERAVREKADADARATQTAELERLRDEEAAERRRREDAERLRREHAETKAESQPSSTRRKLLLLVAVALLLVAGAGAYVFKDRLFGPAGPQAIVQPEIPTTLEGARQFLAGNPGADESFGQAERFLQAKQLDGAFLLLRNAASKGSAPAALALGEMYDPATYSPETSALPAPNPAQAVDWYRQAAEAGIAEAQYRLGQLLLSGKTEEPNGPEMGIAWLRKAAGQGHQGAKDALPK